MVGVVGADADAHVDGVGEGNGGRRGGLLQLFSGADVDGELVSATDDAQAGKAVLGCGDVRGFAAGGGAVLQGDMSVGVDGGIGVGGGGIEALAEDEDGFGGGVAGVGREVYVGGEAGVTGETLTQLKWKESVAPQRSAPPPVT